MIYVQAVKNTHRTVIAIAKNHVATRTAGDEMSDQEQECTCDPCADKDCPCGWDQRCDFCESRD